jgi:hypothetical protein
MAAARALNFQHGHRENSRKPQGHTALAVVNNGLKAWREIYVG